MYFFWFKDKAAIRMRVKFNVIVILKGIFLWTDNRCLNSDKSRFDCVSDPVHLWVICDISSWNLLKSLLNVCRSLILVSNKNHFFISFCGKTVWLFVCFPPFVTTITQTYNKGADNHVMRCQLYSSLYRCWRVVCSFSSGNGWDWSRFVTPEGENDWAIRVWGSLPKKTGPQILFTASTGIFFTYRSFSQPTSHSQPVGMSTEADNPS